MIIRVFRTKVKPGTHEQYEALIQERVVPLMLRAPGLISLHIGCPLDDPPEEFLLMSVWQDLASMRAFVGPRWREAFVLPGEEHLVLHSIVDHRVYAICSDGDLMEGVSNEAASIAGQLGLAKLVYFYDDNHITIDGTTSI